MFSYSIHRIKKTIRNAPNLLSGYSIYVDSDKLRLIDRVFQHILPSAHSFGDLGGVWKVNAAYSLYTLRKHKLQHGFLVDTNFPDGLRERLSKIPTLTVLQQDFARQETIDMIGSVDAVFFFDVLLHQANPSWKEILANYAKNVSCFVIFNQQFIKGNNTIRLTDLPIEEYISLAPRGRDETYRHVYKHADEIHPEYKKPWRDIHNIFQWGITDSDLRATMSRLGFREAYFKNYGRFSNLPAFENHAFVFTKSNL
ncbi:MAG: hypothetical protein HYV29_02045 [Ignavibacteriales bacterium]|nr:hypothetical protein [Ignavibacteriales bacterium]